MAPITSGASGARRGPPRDAPNIITIYDFALHEGEPFLAMEFVYGMSPRRALDEKGAMAVPDAIQVMLDALHYAHDQGVIHQDIKPANIMLSPQMKTKVADFGISRFANTEVTSVSSSMGTPNYMSPEQCRGEAVDARSDLFSASATLFEMVTGGRAFQGVNAAEVTYRIVNESLPSLPTAVRNAAPRLQFVLECAMGKQPEAGALSPSPPARCGSGFAAAPRPSRGLTRSDHGRSSPELELERAQQAVAQYVGPIALVLVRQAAREADSGDKLWQALGLHIEQHAEREAFPRQRPNQQA